MRIRNPFAVHMDPAAIDPAGSDAGFGFIDSWVDVDELREEYPDIAGGLDTGIGHVRTLMDRREQTAGGRVLRHRAR